MMKKSIRITALILALVMVFTGTASADDSNVGGWINLLDYTTFFNGTNNGSVSNGSTYTISLPYLMYVRNIDIVLYSRTAISGISVAGSAMTVVSIGNNLYRCYGDLSARYESLDLVFTLSSSSVVEFYQFNVSAASNLHYADVAIATYDGSSYAMSSSASYASVPLVDGVVSLYCANWKRYDYVDFVIRTLDGTGISSVSADINGVALPVETSILGNFDLYEDATVGEMATTDQYVVIRVDLRGLDRSLLSTPYVYISGEFNYLYLYRCTGYVITDPVNPTLYYFQNLSNVIANCFAVLQARQDAAFQDQVQFHSDMISGFQELQTSIVERIGLMDSNLASKLNYIYNILVSMDSHILNFMSSMESWFSTVSGKLDQLIGGTTEGDELSQGAEDLGESVDQIQDYEQSQQAVLDISLPEIQASVAITGFTAALAFVQRYINLGWSGIGDLSIIYTMPIFIGLFFVICGRVSGRTRVREDHWPKELPGQESWF